MKTIILMLAMLVHFPAFSQEFVVNQQGLQFTPKQISIKVNDVVSFKNLDDAFHNVYSFSDAAFFDLGSYGKGVSKEVQFEEAGEVIVECAVHPDMRMVINVDE